MLIYFIKYNFSIIASNITNLNSLGSAKYSPFANTTVDTADFHSLPLQIENHCI